MEKRDVKDYTALILLTPADFKRVSELHGRMVHYLPAKKVCFVGNAEVGQLLNQEIEAGVYAIEDVERVGFIDENLILSMDDVHAVRSEILAGDASRRATGWFYQQFLKMSYSEMCEDEYYMVWDGDTVPCGRFSMFTQGQKNQEGIAQEVPYFDLKQEYHEPYFTTMTKLIPGMKKVIGKSFISEHMLFRKDLMKKLIERIESNDQIQGTVYWEKVLRCLSEDELHSNSFSEFEMYGTFTALTAPSSYRLREWHSFRLGSEFFSPATITERDFEWLGRDFFAVSFEKERELLPGNNNLFNNPYYQERMSAKQMFQILQEGTGGNLHDEWWGEEKNLNIEKEREDNFNPDSVQFGDDAINEGEYKLFLDMGNQCERTNPKQAWLCYENALFLCADESERKKIKMQMDHLEEVYQTSVDPVAIIVVTRNEKIRLQHCLKNIYMHCLTSSFHLIIVENASSDDTRKWLENCSYDIDLLVSDELLGFASACNAGIQCSKPGQDILLLDCSIRMTHNALFWMRMGLYENDQVGAVGAVSNQCAATQWVPIRFLNAAGYMKYAADSNISMPRPYEEKTELDSIAMLIRSGAVDEIGGMDEIFSVPKTAVTDYSVRLRAAEYQMFICHNAFVYRNVIDKEDWNKQREGAVQEAKLFREKWNFDNTKYMDLSAGEYNFMEEISREENEGFRVLELGAGTGNMLTSITHKYPNAMAVGIEANEAVFPYIAGGAVVLNMDWKTEKLPFFAEYFDYIYVNEKDREGVDSNSVRQYLKQYAKQDAVIVC